MRVERADERAGLPLGPEVGVHLPEGRLDLLLVDAAHGQHGEARRELDRPGRLDDRLSVRVGRGLGDEDHVDVADVVELAGTCLAHADDREARRGDLLGSRAAEAAGRGQLRPGDGERRLEGRAGEVGQGGGHGSHGRERIRVHEVPRGDACHERAIADPQGRPSGRAGDPRHAVDRLHRLQHPGADVGRRGHPLERTGEGLELVRVASEELGEAARRTEHPRQPVTGVGVGEDCAGALGVLAQQSDEGVERPVRVRAGVQRLHEVGLGPAGQLHGLLEGLAYLAETREARAREGAEQRLPTSHLSLRPRRRMSVVILPPGSRIRASRGWSAARTASPGPGSRAIPAAC